VTWANRPRSEAGGGLAWCRAGAGQPVVLIHGVGLRAEAWGAQMEGLAGSFSLHALDLPGHGQSAAFAHQPALGDYTESVAAAVGSIGVPVCLAGHSMGALVALDIASRYPELCRGVAALSPVFRRSREAAGAVRERAGLLSGDRPADPGPTLRRWFGGSLDCPEAAACRRWLLDVNPAGYAAAYRVFAREDGPDGRELAALRCPALFMTGAADPNSTPRMAQEMAGIVQRGRILIVEEAGHMLPMTHAAAVNDALSSFFGQCAGAGR